MPGIERPLFTDHAPARIRQYRRRRGGGSLSSPAREDRIRGVKLLVVAPKTVSTASRTPFNLKFKRSSYDHDIFSGL